MVGYRWAVVGGAGEASGCCVGRALLDTLAAGLGPAFTEEVRAAWTTTYLTLAGVMLRAAAEPQQMVA